MVYDSGRQEVLLFGGMILGTGIINDTWAWNGSQWTQRFPASVPSFRRAAAMAYDALRQQTVLFGGIAGSGPLNDTWTWDGSNWTSKSYLVNPAARFFPAATYDGARQQVVMFGGVDANNSILNDTWIYANNAPTQQFTLTTNSAGGGTVTQSTPGQAGPAYLAGTQVLVAATAAAGYEFEYWSGACTGSSRTCTVTMNGNETATANFSVPLQWAQLAPAAHPQAVQGVASRACRWRTTRRASRWSSSAAHTVPRLEARRGSGTESHGLRNNPPPRLRRASQPAWHTTQFTTRW
jgi:hypothetical protein